MKVRVRVHAVLLNDKLRLRNPLAHDHALLVANPLLSQALSMLALAVLVGV